MVKPYGTSVILIVLIVLMVPIVTVLFTGCGGPNLNDVSQGNKQEESRESKQIPVVRNLDKSKKQSLEYEIAEKEDISFGGVIRYELKIVILPETKQDDIKDIAEEVIQKTVEESDWKAMVIVMFFYDKPEDIKEPYTVARAIWAPYGEISKGIDVKTGDYSKHQFAFNFDGFPVYRK